MRAALAAACAALAIAATACAPPVPSQPPAAPAAIAPPVSDRAAQLIAAAIARTLEPEVYDGSYQKIPYPGGDVLEDRGVCTDLVVRSYRALGIDLQQLVHEDMLRAFSAYPQLWGHSRPDSNIDHRRVPNLRTFFERQGAAQPVSKDPGGYHPGDLVTWRLPGNLPHIGIVADRRSEDGKRPLMVHNIGAGPTLEDMLFSFEITGHYRYALDEYGGGNGVE